MRFPEATNSISKNLKVLILIFGFIIGFSSDIYIHPEFEPKEVYLEMAYMPKEGVEDVFLSGWNFKPIVEEYSFERVFITSNEKVSKMNAGSLKKDTYLFKLTMEEFGENDLPEIFFNDNLLKIDKIKRTSVRTRVNSTIYPYMIKDENILTFVNKSSLSVIKYGNGLITNFRKASDERELFILSKDSYFSKGNFQIGFETLIKGFLFSMFCFLFFTYLLYLLSGILKYRFEKLVVRVTCSVIPIVLFFIAVNLVSFFSDYYVVVVNSYWFYSFLSVIILNMLIFGSKPSVRYVKANMGDFFVLVFMVFLSACPFFIYFKKEPLAEFSANISYIFLIISFFVKFYEDFINCDTETNL